MSLFKSYLKRKRNGLLCFLLFAGIFAGSFALFRLPVIAVVYPLALCGLCGIAFVSVSFLRFKRLHEKLALLSDCKAEELQELPKPVDLIQEDYQGLIRQLQEEISTLESESSRICQDRLEYYTVWAHQIKTPITAMKVMLRQEDTPLSRSLMSELVRTEKYADMVMTYLHLEEGVSDYVFREYSLDELIKAAIRSFAPEFIARKISLEYSPVDKVFVTDEKWFGIVLEQLISNALKYTPSGSVRICMKDTETLCIQDTGIGISPEDINRVFEKGYTGFNGRGEKHSSGIGLYLCRKICKGLNIGIRLESGQGEGTAVCLDLSQNKIGIE